VSWGKLGSKWANAASVLALNAFHRTSRTTRRPGAGNNGLSVGRKREVVLRLLRGESAENLSRELGVPSYRLERWRPFGVASVVAA
jgi:hypothetical protein